MLSLSHLLSPPLMFCLSSSDTFFISLSQGLQQSCSEDSRRDRAGMPAAGQPGLHCLHGVRPEAADPHVAEELRKNGETADPLISM